MVRVAVCQLAGRPLEEAAANLAACRRLVAEAASAGADVVVLPEGSYPAYVLGGAAQAREVLARGPDPREALAALAREHRVVLVAGAVVEGPEGLLNAALTFGPDGAELAVTGKRFLWHFDARWFSAGDASPVVPTEVGRVGALVCADARLPEIARTLAVGGAALVCDPTAWVTSTPGAPANIQPDFLVAARCIENGVAMACASKCGFEGPLVSYAGRSMVVDATGRVVAEASTDREEVVVGELDLGGLPAPPVTRRPELYGELTAAWAARPASVPRVRLAAANGPVPATSGALVAQGVALLVVPPSTPRPDDDGVWCVTADDGVGALVSPDGDVVGRFRPAHVEGSVVRRLAPPVATPVGRIGVLAGPDVFVPEQARIAALRGAEILAVVADRPVPVPVLRARAAENRVFVVAAGDPTVVVAPSGAVVADAPPYGERPFVASADGLLAEAAVKEMAPGTDVFAGRQPDAYAQLTSTVRH